LKNWLQKASTILEALKKAERLVLYFPGQLLAALLQLEAAVCVQLEVAVFVQPLQQSLAGEVEQSMHLPFHACHPRISVLKAAASHQLLVDR